MQSKIEEPKSRKKACNVSISESLIEEAKQANINLSQTLETALVSALKIHKETQWREQNQDAIQLINERNAEYGTFAEQEGLI